MPLLFLNCSLSTGSGSFLACLLSSISHSFSSMLPYLSINFLALHISLISKILYRSQYWHLSYKKVHFFFISYNFLSVRVGGCKFHFRYRYNWDLLGIISEDQGYISFYHFLKFLWYLDYQRFSFSYHFHQQPKFCLQVLISRRLRS